MHKLYICIQYICNTIHSFQPSKENQKGNRENGINPNKAEKLNKTIDKKMDFFDYKKTTETALNTAVM